MVPPKLNPYLRWAVIFDEYIKNRDVWRCPSAIQWGGARDIIPTSDWFGYLLANSASVLGEGDFAYMCDVSFPSGWGGTVTDSILQWEKGGPDNEAFEQTIGCTEFLNADLNLSEVEDPVWYVVVGDIGQEQAVWGISRLAFPDACRAQCGAEDPGCCAADWDNCSWSRDCGVDYRVKHSFWSDPNISKRFTRHMGGSNVGFLDGHAKWWSAMAIVANSQGGELWSGDTTHGKLRIGPAFASSPSWGCMCKYGQ